MTTSVRCKCPVLVQTAWAGGRSVRVSCYNRRATSRSKQPAHLDIIYVTLSRGFELHVHVRHVTRGLFRLNLEATAVYSALSRRVSRDHLFQLSECFGKWLIVPERLDKPLSGGPIVGAVEIVVLELLWRRRKAVWFAIYAWLECAIRSCAEICGLRSWRAWALVLELEFIWRQPVFKRVRCRPMREQRREQRRGKSLRRDPAADVKHLH